MKQPRYTYMFQPSTAMWTEMFSTWPRENLEELLYDLAFSTGVLSGLELTQSLAPNLQIVVRKGRACYLDTTTRRAKIIEIDADVSVNMASYLPAGSPSTVLVVAEPKLETTLSVNVVNAPPSHPDYDAAFTGTTFDRLEFDSYELKVVGAATGQQIVLGSVTLQAGQSAILNSHIKAQNDASSPRQIASPNPKVLALEERIAELEPRVSPIGSVVSWAGAINRIPNGFVLCDGRPLSRVDYAKLFDLLTVAFGNGDGVSTFNIPDLRDKFIVGAGNAYGLNGQGGATEVALSVNHLPSHDHSVTVDGVADHDHGVTVGNSGSHRHTFRASQGTTGGGAGNFPISDNGTGSNEDYDTSSAYGVLDGGNHSHTVDVLPGGSHAHSADVGNTGNNQAHENRPPYVGLFQIIRVT